MPAGGRSKRDTAAAKAEMVHHERRLNFDDILLVVDPPIDETDGLTTRKPARDFVLELQRRASKAFKFKQFIVADEVVEIPPVDPPLRIRPRKMPMPYTVLPLPQTSFLQLLQVVLVPVKPPLNHSASAGQ